MAAPRPSLCITCGLPAASDQPLNRLEDGRACPTCRDRLLDSLPPPFPGFGHLLERRAATRAHGRAAASGPRLSPGAAKKQRRGPKGGSSESARPA
jgi:hypothetical protein